MGSVSQPASDRRGTALLLRGRPEKEIKTKQKKSSGLSFSEAVFSLIFKIFCEIRLRAVLRMKLNFHDLISGPCCESLAFL